MTDDLMERLPLPHALVEPVLVAGPQEVLIPGHIGPPWFLPIAGAYYKFKDRVS